MADRTRRERIFTFLLLPAIAVGVLVLTGVTFRTSFKQERLRQQSVVELVEEDVELDVVDDVEVVVPPYPGRPVQLVCTAEPPEVMKFGFEVLLNGSEMPAPVKPFCGAPGTVAIVVPTGAATMTPRTMMSNRLMP